MAKNPFKDSTEKTRRARHDAPLDVAIVEQVADNSSHNILVRVLTAQTEGSGSGTPTVASVITPTEGEVALPPEGSMVVVARVKGRRPIVLGTVYTGEGAVPTYQAGERVVGHSISGAEVRIKESGEVAISTDNGQPATVNGSTIVTQENGDQIFLAEGSTSAINNASWTDQSFSSVTISDAAYSGSANPTVTIDEAGTYEVTAECDFTSDGAVTRASPNYRIMHNGSQSGVMGRSGYMRDAEGHSASSIHARTIIQASAGDTVHVEAIGEADTGINISPDHAQLSIKRLHR